MLKERKKGGLGRFLLSCTLALLIFSAIGIAGIGIWAGALDTALDEEVFLSAVGDKTTRLYAYDRNGELLELSDDRVSGYENALYCPLEQMSPYLRDAFVAIEDKRFYTHGGIDWIRTLAAAKEYVVGGRSDFGGSTITQQLVKNLTGESEKSVRRKVAELIRAARLEKRLSKNQILEQYLNVVNLSQNCYGVRTAANAYFSKEVQELTLVEAASIAAITNNPTKYDPIRHPERNRERRDVILGEMYRQGMIDRESYLEAIGQQTELHVDPDVMSGRVNSWYADMVVSDVIEALITQKGMTRAAASRFVYCGGLKIYTAVDTTLQEMLSEYYADAENFPTHQGGKKAQSAMMIVDPKSGDILAVAGAVGEKSSNRIQNFATDAKRPSGSVIKPLSVYAPALQRRAITWATVFDDVPLRFRENGAPWPRNAPNLYRGLTTVSSALTDSVNTVSVSVLERLGKGNSLRFLREELGFSSLDAQNDAGAAALALGQQSTGVTLRELIGGYTVLAGGGVYRGTRSFYRVLDAKDNVILEQGEIDRRVLDAENAAIMTMMLRQVVQKGTARSLTLKKSLDVAGKTGTSGNNCDKWFIGYTPELLAGVWYGHEYPESLADVKGNPALLTFDRVMQRAITLRESTKKHLDTSGDIVAVRYCRDSGKLPCEACLHDPRGERIEIGFFKKGTEPTAMCDRHVAVRYCNLGGVATKACPDECCYTTSLLRVSRSFPRQIKVQDAPYTFGGLVSEEVPRASYDKPYYAVRFDKGTHFGIGMDVIPYNHVCPVHGEDPFWLRRARF